MKNKGFKFFFNYDVPFPDDEKSALLRVGKACLESEGITELDKLGNSDIVAITSRGKPIRTKTLGQKEYVEAVRHHELTLAVGPAGTGKTYLAMCLAVAALKNREIERLNPVEKCV